MKRSNNSGCLGAILVIVGIAVCIGGLGVVKKLVPAIFTLALWGAISLIILIIGAFVIIIVLANKASNKPGNAENSSYTSSGSSTTTGSKSPGTVSLNAEQIKIISGARQQLMELRRIILGIKNIGVREAANKVCGSIDRLLQGLREKPGKIAGSRQCLNYYLPTLKEVMFNYKNLEDKNQLADEMTVKAITFLGDVDSALGRHYDNLYDEDKLIMEVDMEAMTIDLKRNGLLEDLPTEE